MVLSTEFWTEIQDVLEAVVHLETTETSTVMVRKQYSTEFKAKIEIEATKGRKTINEITTTPELHSTQITQWKKQALFV